MRDDILVDVEEQERRSLRAEILHSTAILFDIRDDDDTATAERIINVAKRFEQYVVDGI